jgi:hypothetical protein
MLITWFRGCLAVLFENRFIIGTLPDYRSFMCLLHLGVPHSYCLLAALQFLSPFKPSSFTGLKLFSFGISCSNEMKKMSHSSN